MILQMIENFKSKFFFILSSYFSNKATFSNKQIILFYKIQKNNNIIIHK